MPDQIIARPEHEVRVMQELHDLDTRTLRLEAFMRTPAYMAISMTHKQLMARQLQLHRELHRVLSDRIHQFDKERLNG